MNMIHLFPGPLPLKSAGGVQVVHTCHGLAEAGVNVRLLFEDSPATAEEILSAYSLPTPQRLHLIKIPKRKLFVRSNKIFNHYALRKIQDLEGTISIDFLYTRHLKVANFLTRKLRGIPLIYEAHFFYGDLAAERYGRRDRRVDALEKAVLEKASGVVCTSSGLSAAIARTVPDRTLLITIPNGANLYKRAAGKDFRGDPEIIYSGDFSRQKGVEVLIQALQYLEGPKLTLIGGGRRDNVGEMRSYAQRLGLSGVSFTGWLEHQAVQKHLSRAQIGVLPYTSALHARSHISPMKLFEYMASKLAIVVSDLPAMREIVSDEEVLFVKPDDPKALAGGLRRLIENPELRAWLAQKAYERAKDFTWEKRAERLVPFIEEVLARRRRN